MFINEQSTNFSKTQKKRYHRPRVAAVGTWTCILWCLVHLFPPAARLRLDCICSMHLSQEGEKKLQVNESDMETTLC